MPSDVTPRHQLHSAYDDPTAPGHNILDVSYARCREWVRDEAIVEEGEVVTCLKCLAE